MVADSIREKTRNNIRVTAFWSKYLAGCDAGNRVAGVEIATAFKMNSGFDPDLRSEIITAWRSYGR